MCLNDKEKKILNYVFDEFYYEHFNDIGTDSNGNVVSYNDDELRLEQFKTMEKISEKLNL